MTVKLTLLNTASGCVTLQKGNPIERFHGLLGLWFGFSIAQTPPQDHLDSWE